MIATPRRMFLQTTGAALTLPLVGAVDLSAQGRRPDPLLREILRQAKAATQAATRPDAAIKGGEPVRQLANALRSLAAYGGTIGLDEAIAEGLRNRAAALAYRPDLNAIAARLRAEGIDVEVGQLAVVPEHDRGRERALDAVLKNGASATLEAIARSFDKMGERLDKQRGLQPVNRQYVDCSTIFWDLFLLEVTMFAACGPWAAAFPEPCVVAAAAYFAMKGLSCYIWGCC
jgi:hypothetical protein